MLPVLNGLIRHFYINITKLVVALAYLFKSEMRLSYLDQDKDIMINFVKDVHYIYSENSMLRGMH